MKSAISLITLILSFGLTAQTAPTIGKKVLEVMEKYEGEYHEPVKNGSLDPILIEAMKKNVIKKISKYGFNDITINEIGKVDYPGTLTTGENNFRFQANITDKNNGERYKLRISLFGHAPKYIIKKGGKSKYKKTRNRNYKSYYRGPKGGCYYINSSGNKSYVARSLCH